MKPWPKKLAEMYPLPTGVLPERPWWRRELTEDSRYQWEKYKQEQSGCFIRTGFSGLMYQMTRSDGVTVTDGHTARSGEIDAENPLPHPGFRLQQVWGNEVGETRTILGFCEGKPVVFTEVFSVEYDRYLLSYTELDEDYCFLVADPCCPWLAPWASANPRKEP